ncbi:Tim10/DDP family zinc finger-domain-containing protein [Xylariaceae sp. FL0016]|nr:Tim10/DDP family zinc finger-domain-containing protein [Xylariaceae sp. FL0016]
MDVTDLDVDRLNDKDKNELRVFLNNEQQKARIQANVHNLTEVCFKKCVTSNIKSGKLDSSEQSCLANCAERFFDVTNLTVKHLSNLR